MVRDQRRCRLPLADSLLAAARTLLGHLETYATTAPPTTPSGPGDPKDENRAAAAVRSKFSVPAALIASFQQYFFLCVTSVIKSAEDEKFACPVQAFLACFGYKDDDTFRTASEVTSHLAGWQFLLRCTALVEAFRLEQSKQAHSALK